MRRVLIIPAAGPGSRLKAAVPKALVPVNGRPMIDHLLDLFRPFVSGVLVVTHPSFAGTMRAHLARAAVLPHDVAEQPHPTGMLDAILTAAPWVRSSGADRVWIVWCDQVAVLAATLARMADAEVDGAPALLFPAVRRSNPYIHFRRGADGRITAVLQRRENDEMPPEGESDMGVFSIAASVYRDLLPEFARAVTPGSGTGERNFLPFVPWLASRDTVTTIPCTDPREAVGINTPEELAAVEAWLRTRSAGA